MSSPPTEFNQTRRMSALRTFLIGLALMLPWPVFFSIFEPLDSADEYLIYLVGVFMTLFREPLEAIFASLFDSLSEIWATIFIYGIVGFMALMWLVVLCLPFFGAWNRRVALWFSQFSYAAAQAICGWFYAQRFI